MSYLDQKLKFTPDGKLLDENGNAVMMEWERPIMREQAKTICSRGGRVLNIGHGMGIIDSYIQEHENVSEHWIIEAHPDVQREMIRTGWLMKATCIFKPWQEVLNHLPKFDAVYIDTWDESIVPFLLQAKILLKKDGILSMFNNPRGDEKGLHMQEDEYNAIKNWANVRFETFEIPYVTKEGEQRTDGEYYWHPNQKIYYNPIITAKKLIHPTR